MAFKEGTKSEEVAAFRALVAKCVELDGAVDEGILTPAEATDELKKAMEPKKEKRVA